MRLLAALVGAALAFAACNASTPTPTPAGSAASTPPASGSLAPSPGLPSPSTVPGSSAPAGPSGPPPDVTALARTILDQVVQIRGLPVKRDVPPTVMSEADLQAYVERTFNKDNPPDVLAANERLLKGLGLIPAGSSLRDLYLQMLTSQIAGFYSPDDKKLYVISRSGSIGPAEKVTFAHEYTHALQDQSFDLQGLDTDQVGQGDRGLGRLALVEGDATLVMTYWSQQHLTPAELTELLRQSSDPEQLRILGAMPPILRETLLFPYQTGLQFALGLQTGGGWKAVDDAFRRPPASTEQVMHPEKYAAQEAPVALSLPADLATRMGAGWKVGMTDTMGEFQIGIWLRQGGSNTTVGTQAAAGWGGDRIELLDGPNGAWAIAWQTAWDSDADAAEFEAAANAVLPKAAGPGSVLPGAGGRTRWVVVGSDAATLGKLAGVLGLAG